ncbi:Lipoyl synthase, partial [human gut metagenome]
RRQYGHRIGSHLPLAKEEEHVTDTIAPQGRKLLRVEARNAETPIEHKPRWLRTKAVISPTYQEVRGMVRAKQLHTVCGEGNCPN